MAWVMGGCAAEGVVASDGGRFGLLLVVLMLHGARGCGGCGGDGGGDAGPAAVRREGGWEVVSVAEWVPRGRGGNGLGWWWDERADGPGGGRGWRGGEQGKDGGMAGERVRGEALGA